MDPYFPKDSYIIKWNIIGGSGKILGQGERIDIETKKDMIRERSAIACTIKSTYDWHRYALGYDQQFAVIFNVLLPRI